ncbi:MAG TPA: TolC family protein [Bacteroidia bacterium]|nr:TolC family protein [Bacteroidia bacterium]
MSFRNNKKNKSFKYSPLKTGILFFSAFAFQFISAQNYTPLKEDTLYLNIPAAEQRFVSMNLSLLSKQYDVKISQATYLQAKLWYNPNLTYGQTLYNEDSKKFFDNNYPTEGAVDRTFQLQQLLTIGGRHSATAKLAKVGVKQSELQLADLLRSLKYQLYTDISDLYNNQALVNMYVSEEAKIKHLLESTRAMYKLGNASGNDVIRLQAQLQDIVAQEITSRQAIANDEQDLGILLVYPGNTYIVVKDLGIPAGEIPPYMSILDSAKNNRPDLKLAYAGVQYSEQNLKLQHSTAIPDLTLGVVNQGAGSVVPDYWGITANIDLPVFNRNQWNVTQAKEQKKQAELNDSLALYSVMNQVTASYTNLYRINNQYLQIDAQYERDLNEMMDNAINNYDKRYINLLDLLSQITTYIDGKTNLITMKVQYFNAIHAINYTTGIDIIK